MIENSDYSYRLDKILQSIFKALKPLGFIRKDRLFNRRTSEGLLEVIHFQTIHAPPGGKDDLPGFRPYNFGKFTVNLGIWIPELFDETFPGQRKKMYEPFDCSLRILLSKLTRGDEYWWSLDEKASTLSQEILEALKGPGRQWLNQLNTYQKIEANWVALAESQQLVRRAKLDVALMKILRNEEDGKDLFREYFQQKHPEGHRQYLLFLAQKYGVEL